MTVDLALLDTERCPQPGPHVVVSTDAISASDQLVSPLLSGRPDVTFVDPGSGTLRPLRRWLDDPRVAGQPVMLDVDASVPFGTVAMVLRTAAAAGAVPVEFIVLHPDRAMLYPLRTARLICPPAIPAATPWGEAISRCTVAEGDVSADE
jgi:hypothetical protein